MEQAKVKNDTGKWIAAMASAVLLGATLGVLLAPKSGRETREILRNRINDARSKMKNRGK